RLGDRGARACLPGQLDPRPDLRGARSLCRHHADLSGDRLYHPAGAAPGRAALRGQAMSAMETALAAMPFLWQGLFITVQVSLLSVALSLVAGGLLGLALTYGNVLLRWPIRIFTDVIRGLSILVLLFLIYYLLPIVWIDVSPYWSGVLALSVFKTAHTIEIVRGSIQSVPSGQFDAGKAIGLTFWQRMIYIAVPQAPRRFLPPWINSVADMVKGSALVSLLGV